MPLLFDSSTSSPIETANTTSFSGADMKAVIYRPDYRIEGAHFKSDDDYPGSAGLYHEMGSIQTLSMSSFREKTAVRSLGFQGAMGYTRGNRTIAGTMVFALLNTHPFNDTGSSEDHSGILRNSSGQLDLQPWGEEYIEEGLSEHNKRGIVAVQRKHQYDFTWDSQVFGELMYPDELPPFDVIITLANEAGNLGKMVLHGVDIHQEGMTLSIEDLFTEAVYSYTALGMTMFEEGEFGGRLWGGPYNPYSNDWALRELYRERE